MQMLITLAAEDWWGRLSHEEQIDYLKKHPKSKKKPTTLTKKPTVSSKASPTKPSVVRLVGFEKGTPLVRVKVDGELKLMTKEEFRRLRDKTKVPQPEKQNSAQRIRQELSSASKQQKDSFMLQHKERQNAGMARVFNYQQDDISSVTDFQAFAQSTAYKKWDSSLSKEEKIAIDYYSRDGYFPINSLLRTGVLDEDIYLGEEGYGVNTKKDVLKMADHVESAIRKSKSPKKMTVFRGLALEKGTALGELLNKGITDPAFMSTSTSAEVAGRFTASSVVNSAIVVMNVAKGSPAMFVPCNTEQDNKCERELLLPRNTKIVPTKIEEQAPSDAPPRFIVHAEVVFAKN
jgi:hypothetical protein